MANEEGASNDTALQENIREKTAPLAKNDDIVLDIDAMGSEGQGIGRYEGFTVMVPFALPLEQVQVHIIKVAKSYAVGKLMRILKASPERVQAPCPVFGQCGGCAMQHIDYRVQKEKKHRQVTDALRRIGGFDDVKVEPVIGMDNPWRYRNKAAFPAGEVRGNTRLGMYASNSHRLIVMDDCLIQHAADAELIALLNHWVAESGILPYLESSDEGTLRHVIIRKTTLGEVMVIVVTKGALFGEDKLVSILSEGVEGLKSIIHNRNDEKTNVILGKRSRLLYGSERVTEAVDGLMLGVSAASFLQVNPVQNEKVIEMMLEDAALTGSERVLDLYCGIGALSLHLARNAYRVVGVEIVKEAVDDAQHNALVNGFENAAFVSGDVVEVLSEWRAQNMTFDVVVIDPPRKGSETGVLKRIVDCKPKRIVYISCNPATLARDARILSDDGYRVERVRPVDMFPQTPHVETIMLLVREDK